MRSVADETGRVWDVVLGRESWGRTLAIFVPRDGRRDVREAALDAPGYEEADRELDTMGDAEIRALLKAATPKDLG